MTDGTSQLHLIRLRRLYRWCGGKEKLEMEENPMSRKTALVGAAMLVAACAGSANAQTYAYNVDFNAPGAPGVNNNGGTFDSLSTTFNHSTNRLTFSVTFANQVTKGFTLAINGGANPKGHGGEMALFYFDASSLAAPKLTAYNYNGQNNITSYFDGDGATAGIQAPDKIQSNGDLGVGDTVSAQDSGGKRTLSFSIDASTIIGHNPLYGTPGDWTGAQYAENFGIWMHPFRTFNPTYNANGDITNLQSGGQGWFDGTYLQTTLIPLPSAAAMAGVGLFGIGLRRRR